MEGKGTLSSRIMQHKFKFEHFIVIVQHSEITFMTPTEVHLKTNTEKKNHNMMPGSAA